MERPVTLPPFGLWLVGLLYILETVNLRLPRWTWVGSLAINDVIDGGLVPLGAALLCYHNFSQLPFGLSLFPFALLSLKLIGSGAHAVASSVQASLASDRLTSVVVLVGQFHQCAHWLAQVGELGLLACFFWMASPKVAPNEDAGVEMPGHILASVHGLVAGTHAVGTKTTPLLFIVWFTIAAMSKRRHKALSSSVMRYAFLFCGCSFLFVIVWGVMHNGAWPTFEDANAASAALAQ